MVAPDAVAENVFGTLGAIFWSLQLVPQLWKSWRRKDTAGLSTLMLFLWGVSGVWLGAYCYTSDLSVPLIIQPQLFTLFSILAWAQCLHYDSKYSSIKAWAVVAASIVVCGAIEAGLIVGCRHLQDQGIEKLNHATGIIAAIFVIAGLLPQYWEVWKFKAVVGVSLIFLSIDLLGGVWSLLSLVFSPPPFDALAAVSYSSVVALEIGIFCLAALLNPRYYRNERKRRLQEEEREREATEVAGAGGSGAPTTALETRESTLAPMDLTPSLGNKGGAEIGRKAQGGTSSAEGAGFGWLGGDDVERVRSRPHIV